MVSAEHNAETGEMIAVKQFNRGDFDQTKFLREVETLARLNHPCVLRILAWTPQIGRECAEIRTALAENGSLNSVLEKVDHGAQFPFWHPTGQAILICGIALGMRFVHSKGIIHGDLKPSNILLNGRGEALISDFGSSRFESNDCTGEDGSVHYAAPELFRESAIHTGQADVFTFGLLMYEILTGRAVFPSSDEAFPIIRRLLRRDMPAVPDECGSVAQDLIRRCWAMEPEKRPTFDQILRDFKAAGFRIVPRADHVKLGRYVKEIEKWEADEALQSQSH
jgi:serine/threonine protein kinase